MGKSGNMIGGMKAEGIERVKGEKRVEERGEDRVNNIGQIDRVNNIEQKERAIRAAGITREKVYGGVAEGLTATKKSKKVVDGVWVEEEVADEVVRYKHRELALNALGDLERNKVVEEVRRPTVTVSAEELIRLAGILGKMNDGLFNLPREMRGEVIDV